MKIDTLSFVQHLLQNQGQSPAIFHPHAPVLVPAIIAAVSDPFYKISSEALLVLESLVKILRPFHSDSKFDFKPYTGNVYQCCFARLKASDIDQEVKERAISCMGYIVAHLGDHLKTELPNCLPIFLDRLKNEITRLTAVKALICIARSELKIDLKPILADSMPILASFLRKNQRTLKLNSLNLLDTLVQKYAAQITGKALEPVLLELQPLLNDSDLHIAQFTMNLLTSVAKLHPASLPTVQKTCLTQIFQLSQSSVIQVRSEKMSSIIWTFVRFSTSTIYIFLSILPNSKICQFLSTHMTLTISSSFGDFDEFIVLQFCYFVWI